MYERPSIYVYYMYMYVYTFVHYKIHHVDTPFPPLNARSLPTEKKNTSPPLILPKKKLKCSTILIIQGLLNCNRNV